MYSTWSSPNPILYGCGAVKSVGEQLKKRGCTKVVIVFDSGIKAAGVVDTVAGYIRSAGIEVLEYGDVLPEAPDYTIDKAAEFARNAGVDGVVAIGGGSSIDTGKGVDLLLSNEPPISRWFDKPGFPVTADFSALKPLIVIPTTAGTGSEVTPGGACGDTTNNVKTNFCCPVTLGIVDPELTLSLPASVTAHTGFDALCHATEAVLSNEPNMFSQLFGLNAVSLVSKNLPIAVKDGKNIEARAALHLAATQASMSILGPFCNIPHDIGCTIGVIFHIAHGVACSFVLPEYLKFVAPAIPDRVKLLVEAMGATVPDDATPEQIGEIGYNAMMELMRAANMPQLKDFMTKEQLMDAVPEIMATQNFYFSPRKPVTEEDIRDMLTKTYDAVR